jgi:hypothetical protein
LDFSQALQSPLASRPKPALQTEQETSWLAQEQVAQFDGQAVQTPVLVPYPAEHVVQANSLVVSS